MDIDSKEEEKAVILNVIDKSTLSSPAVTRYPKRSQSVYSKSYKDPATDSDDDDDNDDDVKNDNASSQQQRTKANEHSLKHQQQQQQSQSQSQLSSNNINNNNGEFYKCYNIEFMSDNEKLQNPVIFNPKDVCLLWW